jgi:hypothetical protein
VPELRTLEAGNNACMDVAACGPFVVRLVRCGQVKFEGLPQLSPQAALGFDL